MEQLTKLSQIRDNIHKISVKAYRRTRKWSNIVKESKADIVIVFSRTTNEFLIDWLVAELNDKIPQLNIEKVYQKLSKKYALYLKCNQHHDLLLGAEKIALKKQLNEDYGGHLADFSIAALTSFVNYDEEEFFFTSEERIIITNNYLSQFRADSSDFGKEFNIQIEKGEHILNKLQSMEIIEQIFPLHDKISLAYLKNRWLSDFSFSQPIKLAREYFGVRTGFYFAWMDHYTKSLIIPAILSIIYWLCSDEHVEIEKKCSYYLFSVIIYFMWMTFYLTSWRRASNEYAYNWGTIEPPSELLEEPRPQFKGTYMLCPVTKQYHFHYPEKKRLMTIFLISLPVSLLSMLVIIAFSILMNYFQESVDIYYDDIIRNHPMNANYKLEILKFLPKIIFSVGVIVFDAAYRSLSKYLTDLENHRLEEDYNNFFAARLFIFQFFNSYFFLFYTAFVIQDLESLVSLLSTTLVMRQIVGNFKEFFLPLGITKWKQFLISFKYQKEKFSDLGKTLDQEDSESARDMLIHQAENEATKMKYDDSSEDYLEMVLQFGYISMFAAVFPLGPVFALINNIVEIRSDAFKLMTSYQRPFPKKSNNIGIWQAILDYMSYLGLITNLALLFINGTVEVYLPGYEKYQQVLILFAIEHIIIFIRSMINYNISSVPLSVKKSMAMLEVKRREKFKMFEKEFNRSLDTLDPKENNEFQVNDQNPFML